MVCSHPSWQPAWGCACKVLLLAAFCVSSITAQQAAPAPAPTPASNEYVYVKLIFDGMSQSAFEAYNNGTLYTVAAAAGVPPDYVWRVGAAPASSSSTDSSSTNSSSASMLVASSTSTPADQQQQATATTTSSSSSSTSSSATPNMLMASSNHPVAGAAGTAEPADAAVPVDNNLCFVEASSNTVVQASTAKSPKSVQTLGRKLLAEQAISEYGIKTNRSMGEWATAEVIRRKVLSSAAGFGQASAAGFGKGFYATLEKNGVPYQPQVFLDNTQILAGGLSTEAPKSRFGARTVEQPKLFSPQDLSGNYVANATELKSVQPEAVAPTAPPAAAYAPAQPVLAPWAIAVIAVAGFLFLSMMSVFVWRLCVGSRQANRMASRGSSEQFLSNSSPDAPAAGAV